MTVFEKARQFVYRSARPIDLARWQFCFEGGGAENVLKALSFYQNGDGGFGHALEADSWNPNSSPMQTWAATEILYEVGLADASHPMIGGILKYLAGGRDFDGRLWSGTVISNNDYPHAPWWHAESDGAANNDYNPTACLAGFIVRFAAPESELYRLGCRIVKEAYEQLMKEEHRNDMHTVACYIRMLEYCRDANARIIDIGALESRLRSAVSESITKNTAEWEYGYVCRPSQFIGDKSSVFYKDNRELADYECDFIVESQLGDGSWNIPWEWNAYPNEWAVSRSWWKSVVAVNNMRYLKALGGI